MHIFFLCSSSLNAGLTTVSLGLARCLDRQGVRVAFCKPISQKPIDVNHPDSSIEFAEKLFGIRPPEPISIDDAEDHLRRDAVDDLMERVVAMVESLEGRADVVVVEGLLPEAAQSFKGRLNSAVARTLGADVIIVGRHKVGEYGPFEKNIDVSATTYGSHGDYSSVAGCIANRVKFEGVGDAEVAEGLPVLTEASGDSGINELEIVEKSESEAEAIWKNCELLKRHDISFLGCIPDNPAMRSVRMVDIASELNAEVLYEGDLKKRRVASIALTARNLPNVLRSLRPGALIIAPADRHDLILTVSLAAINKVALAGLVLTGSMELDKRTMELCEIGFKTSGLPVLRVRTDSFRTASILASVSPEVPVDDFRRLERVIDFVARSLSSDWFRDRVAQHIKTRMSPAAFRHMVSKMARANPRKIVLPEGEEPRTIEAAAACEARGIAQCVLLGNPDNVRRIADAGGVQLPSSLTIIDPVAVRENYLAPLLERRAHKGLSEERAREGLEDTVVLGTMMLELGEVDGLVSGAVHSSANTIRPALQIIKTKPDAGIVSSVFFMCLPDQVLVYGDCAVNPDPKASELADIAIQSADTAVKFGIEPIVALISYSTGSSGSGADVEKVVEAVKMVKERRPDLLVDGPLQYDSASTPDVAAKKAPDSPVAGKATVFVFPDLNTGNTTYKAVQRSANLISIGPVLQGLKKPVNDLSRGALVDDIIYTIAVTAIQAVE
ncbi:MAG: phosphate acetyltransferase [Opitutales bacterium]